MNVTKTVTIYDQLHEFLYKSTLNKKEFTLVGKEHPRWLIFRHFYEIDNCTLLLLLDYADPTLCVHIIYRSEINQNEILSSVTVDLDARVLAFVKQVTLDNNTEEYKLVIAPISDKEISQEKLLQETFQRPIQVQFVKQGMIVDQQKRTTNGTETTTTTGGGGGGGAAATGGGVETIRRVPNMNRIISSHKITLHLLLFRIHSCVCTKQIQMVHTDDGEILWNPQIQEKQILKDVSWSQWDSLQRRLFILTGPHQSSSSSRSNKQKHAFCRFEAYQFYFQSGNLLSASVIFRANLRDLHYASIDSSQYNDVDLTKTFSADHVIGNTETFRGLVLTHSNGCICFCIMTQPIAQTNNTTTPTSSSFSSFASSSKDLFPLYHKVYLFHNERIISCTGSVPLLSKDNNNFSQSKEEQKNPMQISMSLPIFMIQNYLIIKQNNFLHLINIDANTSVCLSAIISLENSPSTILFSDKLTNLSPLIASSSSSASGGTAILLDQCNGMILNATLDVAACYKQFCTTRSNTNRLALVNLIVELNHRDLDVVRDLFHTTMHKMSGHIVRSVIMEYLVASVYQRFSKMSTHKRQKYFLTATTVKERTQEQIVMLTKNSENNKIFVTVSIQSQPFVVHSVEMGRDLQQLPIQDNYSSDQLWMKFNQEFIGHQTCSHYKLFYQSYKPRRQRPQSDDEDQQAADDASDNENSYDKNNKRPQRNSLFQSIKKNVMPSTRGNNEISSSSSSSSSLASRNTRQRRLFNFRPSSKSAENIFGSLPSWLEEEPLFSIEDCLNVEWKMLEFLSEGGKRREIVSHPGQKQKIAHEYTTSLLIQIRTIFHIVAHLLAPAHVKTHRSAMIILLQSTDEETVTFYHALHNIRLILLEEDYPVPLSVNRLYTCLAYKLLPPPVFLRHWQKSCFDPLDEEILLCILKTSIIDEDNATTIHNQTHATHLEILKENILNLLPWERRLSLASESYLDNRLRLLLLTKYTNDVIFAADNSSSSSSSSPPPCSINMQRRSFVPTGANQPAVDEQQQQLTAKMEKKNSKYLSPLVREELQGYLTITGRKWDTIDDEPTNALTTFVGLLQRIESAKGLASQRKLYEKSYRQLLS